MLVAVLGGAFTINPALRDDIAFLSIGSVWTVALLMFSRLRWPVRSPADRLVAGFFVSVVGIGATLWHQAPQLDGLLVLFVLSTTAAGLLLTRNQNIAVTVLACVLTIAVVARGAAELPELLFAGAVICSCVLTAKLAEIAMAVTVRIQAAATAASSRDELTRLPGRQSFLRHAELVHARAIEAKTAYAIELIDINNLKAINDAHGYAAGDRAVNLVAEALQRLRGPDEFLARYDGDKFIMLVKRLEGDRADELARRIRSAVFSTTFDVDTELVRIKANVGSARYPIDGVTLNALISAAERDMKLDQRGRGPKGKKPVFRRRSGKMSA